MNILNYGKIDYCFVSGAIYDNIEKFISIVISNLSDSGEPFVHPKELERQERLKQRAEARMNARVAVVGNYNRVAFQEALHHTLEEGIQMSPLSNCGTLEKSIKYKKTKGRNGYNDAVIIVSGNCGIGTKSIAYYEAVFKRFNTVLEKNNCHVLFVRGNNDNPSFFEEDKFNLSNIKCVKDYSVVKFKNFNCLCVGGATSIDKKWKMTQGERLGKQMYWEGENVVYDEKKLDEITKKYEISFVVTCTSPSFAYPGTNSFNRSKWVTEDKETLKSLIEERYVMDRIYNKLTENGSKPYVWFYDKFENNSQNNINDMVFHSLSNYRIIAFNNVVEENFGLNIAKKLSANSTSFDQLIKNTPTPFPIEDFGDAAEDFDVEREHADLMGEAIDEEEVDGRNGVGAPTNPYERAVDAIGANTLVRNPFENDDELTIQPVQYAVGAYNQY